MVWQLQKHYSEQTGFICSSWTWRRHLTCQKKQDVAVSPGNVRQCASLIRVSEDQEFEVKVRVHPWPVCSPLLFIIMQEALPHQFHSLFSWEDCYADNLVTIADLKVECVRRLLTLKKTIQEKGLRVCAGKTNAIICGTGLDLQQNSCQFRCVVCRAEVGK